MPPLMRRIFQIFNKYFMVPMFLLGMGPFFGNPLTGYIMVLKVIGRKTGKLRLTPVNYALRNGCIYCISGGRKRSDWYRNLMAHPEIDVILPTGTIFGHVAEVNDTNERQAVLRQILKNAGFAGFFEGYNPSTISEEDLAQKSADLPVLRVRALGVGSGPSDPGGWSWVWTLVFMLVVLVVIIMMVK
jgi:deazaflavin-dependent oxidoreductase (nitroreductase family)